MKNTNIRRDIIKIQEKRIADISAHNEKLYEEIDKLTTHCQFFNNECKRLKAEVADWESLYKCLLHKHNYNEKEGKDEG